MWVDAPTVRAVEEHVAALLGTETALFDQPARLVASTPRGLVAVCLASEVRTVSGR